MPSPKKRSFKSFQRKVVPRTTVAFKRKCSLCGKVGHNRNNTSYHPFNDKASSPFKKIRRSKGDKYESCVMKVKAKQSTWCANRGYPAYKISPSGKRCYNPFAVCSRLTSV